MLNASVIMDEPAPDPEPFPEFTYEDAVAVNAEVYESLFGGAFDVLVSEMRLEGRFLADGRNLCYTETGEQFTLQALAIDDVNYKTIKNLLSPSDQDYWVANDIDYELFYGLMYNNTSTSAEVVLGVSFSSFNYTDATIMIFDNFGGQIESLELIELFTEYWQWRSDPANGFDEQEFGGPPEEGNWDLDFDWCLFWGEVGYTPTVNVAEPPIDCAATLATCWSNYHATMQQALGEFHARLVGVGLACIAGLAITAVGCVGFGNPLACRAGIWIGRGCAVALAGIFLDLQFATWGARNAFRICAGNCAGSTGCP